MTSWDAVIRGLLMEARRAAGGASALAAALKDAGVGPESGAYSESAVSNWIKGRTRPPADVVLASAALYSLSLDQPLGVTEPAAKVELPQTPEGDEVGELRAAVTRLETLVNARISPRGGPMDAPAVKDIVAVYSTREETQAAMPLVRTLAAADRADVMGLSLNAVCQGISDVTLAELIENGLHLRCLFLDPDGTSIRAREDEEGMPAGHLAELTRTNMHALLRLTDQLSPQAVERLQIRTYDETLRFNITIVDGYRAIVQPYLHDARGLDSPTLVIEANEHEPHGLFPIFGHVFTQAWDAGHDVHA
ncbi:DUF5919 domain-containing protein [Phytoactinopolyspora mesophila]|uniref:DUF5919 domain-containing protein n=1 Tax=Phytoactinopolyspora mesophila TaxID=2650750 RepID=UPI001FE72746|nr:DUF5919 domain-containing protein [Phytoactinopolyspora mesophila]